jgi:hypothetical protein
MKESPIIFSTPMVKANLEGRKTKTRRLNGLDEINENPEWYWLSKENYIDRKGRFCQKFFTAKGFSKIVNCPYGNIGDLLWVRETFVPMIIEDHDGEGNDLYTWLYKTEPGCDNILRMMEDSTWKPSIHMPKSAARIWLKITDIRLERLHDISEEDAIKEGIIPLLMSLTQFETHGRLYFDYSKHEYMFNDGLKPIESFKSLWESINGKNSWDANPWVWVITFEKYDR